MNKNLKTICAALAIALLPVSATCLAKTNVEERYETIWVEAENTNKETQKKVNAGEYSIDDVVRFKSDKAKTDACMGKEIVVKMKVCKIKEASSNSYIMSKDSSMKKAKCVVSKEDAKKCKEGDEVVVKGILKEIKGNKIILEDAVIVKVMDVNSKEYNKDKYKEKNKEENKESKKDKEEEKSKDKCNEMKKGEEHKEEHKKEKSENKNEDLKKDNCDSNKEDEETSIEEPTESEYLDEN